MVEERLPTSPAASSMPISYDPVVALASDFPEACPENIFETDARLVTADDDRMPPDRPVQPCHKHYLTWNFAQIAQGL
jgi:hypothetical protein